MVENYTLAVKTVSRKMSKNHTMYPFMVCALYGLLCKYKGHEKLVLSLFSKTDIIFENGSLPEILKRHHIEMDFADPVQDSPDGILTTLGASNQGHNFVSDGNGNVYYKREKPFVVCSTSNTNMTRLLNTFCHEMGHLIKGEVNGYSSKKEKDSFIYVIRTGLAHYVYRYQKNFQEMDYITSFGVLDEAINCIQTTDVMREILALGEFCEDEDIQSFIHSLDVDVMNEDHGYEDIVLLVRLFWNQDSFKELVEKNIVTGNIDSIVQEFDSFLGEESFDYLSYLLEEIYFLLETDNDKELDKKIDEFKKLVQEYKKCIKMNKKEN